MTQSFHDLLLESLPRLHAHAMALTRDRSKADDLIQETVLRALRARDQFQTGTNFNAWLHRILRNQHISFFRKQHAGLLSIDDISETCLAQAPTQENHAIILDVAKALGKLPKEQRQALVLICGNELSYDEVSQAVGCSIGTIKSRVWRARRQMERLMLGTEAEGRPQANGGKAPQFIGPPPPRTYPSNRALY